MSDMTSQQLEEKIDEILMGMEHSGYNRHVLEIDPRDVGHDEYVFALDHGASKQALLALIAEERLEEIKLLIGATNKALLESKNSTKRLYATIQHGEQRKKELEAQASKETSI